ncbi:3'-5' exonuclease [Prosthecochloris sp. N3]|uniref:3'-5' exonuclease n=1 Tax=Prosthecochloris ethylica TaxID=2743976 RepID=A0ABR9XPL7_9CHLB|nr:MULTISPECIES: 3'-5' exonuclease [Prosthecochloris]MEC9487656.1 3'-5' exonuclease [Prosthecochloris sp.]MBF0586224.1 3'-5' exonuclease [Prosthecochloris ethylica]MBF0635930.1 3'-5' exonuclease [Prosthecochloris ethylica]NUK47395.1 3'-5' exonuclease [Prosthecochloris ethylica]RNA64947.1 3'-5' exonuclease [Prosthecochloris sp. ZM_2]
MRRRKVLYCDVETTGTDPSRHAIIQIGAIMEIDGVVAEEINISCAPFKGARIDDTSLEVTGTTRYELQHRMPDWKAYGIFRKFLLRHIEQYDQNDKCYPAGYNVRFDLNFIQSWFHRNDDTYGIGSFINWRMLDPLPLLFIRDFTGTLSLPDYRLETVCRHFGIELKPHDAMSDIRATRQLLLKLLAE